MDGHYGVYRYSCPFCKYKTQYQTSYQYHEKLHQGERPHNCPHCPKTFIDIPTLNLHMRTHTGEAPFKCDICKKPFRSRYAWKYHLLRCDPDHPALKRRKALIQRLPKKEAAKSILAAASAKPRSHEKTILDFIKKNQVVSSTDDSDQGDRENSDSNDDAESVMVIENDPASPQIISSESASEDQEELPGTPRNTSIPTKQSTSSSRSISTQKIPTPTKATLQPNEPSSDDKAALPATPKTATITTEESITPRSTTYKKPHRYLLNQPTTSHFNLIKPQTARASTPLPVKVPSSNLPNQPTRTSQSVQDTPQLAATSHATVTTTTPAVSFRKPSSKEPAKLTFTSKLVKIPFLAKALSHPRTFGQTNSNVLATCHSNLDQGTGETAVTQTTKPATMAFATETDDVTEPDNISAAQFMSDVPTAIYESAPLELEWSVPPYQFFESGAEIGEHATIEPESF